MNAPFPTHPDGWSIIVADPAWRFAANSDAKPGRSARRHYATLTVEEIAGLPVREIAAKQALLLLWITVPLRHRADEVVRSWGFRSKSELVWVKQRIATGYWARNQHEPCVIATRGGFPCPRPALFPTSIIPGAQREHSRKPEALQDVLDARLPGLPRLELFGRRQRPGWTVWGNDSERFTPVPETTTTE